MKKVLIVLVLLFSGLCIKAQSNDTVLWHNKQRVLRYHPEGNDFVIVNGNRRFVRALYGTNTAFRIEAGDLPEFALYMPGMGGNLKFGLIAAGKTKWLINAAYIKAIYRPGSMLYEIRDSLLGNGVLYMTILALADAEGLVIKTEFRNVTTMTELVTVFGGATGKKFSRDGDIGADPESSFYLKEENCIDNSYSIDQYNFNLFYGTGKPLSAGEQLSVLQSGTTAPKNLKQLKGVFPPGSSLRLVDAASQQTPELLYQSTATIAPAIAGKKRIENTTSYLLVYNPSSVIATNYNSLKDHFNKAEAARLRIADRVKIRTPDKYINTLGAALSIAADAIWEDPSYLHGAIAWRMRLNAWRGAYVADPLGWHDRARKHFSSYALSQVTTSPVTGVVMDTALHLARHLEKIGTALFSDGYICRNPNGDIRAHHYDMNLVFVDQLLNHFNWTGDTAYVRQMWPLLKRHLAWEKRNFDADGDGLYDAYAAIWASDALQYSGGGVTHTSAYNYRANQTVAELASLIGEDGTLYKKEAERILAAIQKDLWLPADGSYAEYKDLLGKKLVHPAAGLWTIYQAIDSKVPNRFQAYQSLRYVATSIPRIPVKAKGLTEKDLYLLSTSNWQPYTWSINNVALAENLQTALAYWQGNMNKEAYQLWRSAIIESMYLSASPGGFEQLSYYDAIRGELYRDFADPIGVAARTVVEGLFGIRPDALRNELVIQPGYPLAWEQASLQVPDIQFSFERKNNTDNYLIKQSFSKQLKLKLLLPAYRDAVQKVMVNGVAAKWKMAAGIVNQPLLSIELPAANQYKIELQWQGATITPVADLVSVKSNSSLRLQLKGARVLRVYDPQTAVDNIQIAGDEFTAHVLDKPGYKTIFTEVQQGIFTWWQPVNLEVAAGFSTAAFTVNEKMSGNLKTTGIKEKLDLTDYFNDKVTDIFNHQYLSPRPLSPTLQLPTQGIGNWCYPLVTAAINDNGTRKLAGMRNEIFSMDSIPFSTPADSSRKNIVFTSQWDNFPDTVNIALSGKAGRLHLLLAGTTNPMQSRITNGMVVVSYTEGKADTLLLKNPENWWPIEQDYYTDGFAFTTGERPERLYLKEGRFSRDKPVYSSIKGFTDRAVDGGAATVLAMYLDDTRTLKTLTLYAIANDVVIGLMAATLTR